MHAWYEESAQVSVHPRAPYHRVDVLDSDRHVKAEVNGEVVAETDHPKILFETGLPPRYYFRPEDFREEALVPSDKQTECPYKGVASYWSVEAGGDRGEDLVWYYPEPIPAAGKIKDHLCFFNEKVNLEVDGEPQERPQTLVVVTATRSAIWGACPGLGRLCRPARSRPRRSRYGPCPHDTS